MQVTNYTILLDQTPIYKKTQRNNIAICEIFITSNSSNMKLKLIIYPLLIGSLLSSCGKQSNIPIAIVYRSEGEGKGAFYDHYTFQTVAKCPTVIALSGDGTCGDLDTNQLENFIKNNPYGLSYGTNKEGKIVPDSTKFPHEQGLLVIPGRERAQEYVASRDKYERKVIKEALRRGQPILAICAGCWQIWEASDCKFEEKCTKCMLNQNNEEGCVMVSKFKDVKDHVASRMMSLGKNGNITYNMQIHRINPVQSSLLFKAMGNPTDISVNSVHWKVPVCFPEDTIHPIFDISATAKHDAQLAPNNRSGAKMQPEEGTVEAFERRFGAPTVGIQWHPEAYATFSVGAVGTSRPYNIKLLQYMVKAGEAYYYKVEMLQELKQYFTL